MKIHRFAWLSLLLVAALASTVRADPPTTSEPPSAKAPEPPPVEAVWLEVSGVVKEKVSDVETGLKGVEGVKSVDWSIPWTPKAAEVHVVREVGKASDDALAKAVAATGGAAQRVPVVATTFVFNAKLHCPGCVELVRDSLGKMAGVKQIDLPKDWTKVTASYDKRAITVEALSKELARIGHPATVAPAP
jgi:copper chaperone CopZ